MARSSRNAFSSDWRRQYFAAMRSRAAVRGKISPWCVPRRPSVTIFSLHASPKGPRTGKAPLPGNISPPCIQNELGLARYARHVSEKPRKSPFGNAPRADLAREGPFSLHGPLESCIPRRSCHPSPPNSASAAASVSAPSARPIALKRGPEADVTRPTVAPRTARALATPTLAAANRQAAFPECGASLAPVAIKVAVAFRLPYA